MVKIPLNAATFGEDEINAAIEVLRSGNLTMSELCLRFESDFSNYITSPNSCFVNSGSSANLLAFFGLVNPLCPEISNKKKCKPGMEVIVPALTWSTTIWPIVQAGLIPVLVDCDPKTLQMKATDVKNAINTNTAAICAVHVMGNSVDISEISNIAEENKLWLVEDSCEAMSTTHQEKMVGTFGDIGTFSFFYSHHITTIEGGMAITPHDEIAELLRSMRAHGWTRNLKNSKTVNEKHPTIDPRFLFITTGFNLRPTEINAAFGIEQLRKINQFNKKRSLIAQKWLQDFSKLTKDNLLMPMQPTRYTKCSWFGFPVIFDNANTRDKIKTHLESHGIETRPIICGNLARQPAFKYINHRISGKLTGSDIVMDRGLFWGASPFMSEADITYVSETVLDYFK